MTQSQISRLDSSVSNTQINDTQIEDFMDDDEENKQNDDLETEIMSMDSTLSQNPSHRSSQSNQSPRFNANDKNELPPRVKQEYSSKRRKRGRKINLNILNQAIKSEDASTVTNLPYFPLIKIYHLMLSLTIFVKDINL